MIPVEAIEQPGAFDDRDPAQREAILLNIYCERCERPATTPVNITEYSLGEETWVQATCMRCGQRADINLLDVP